MKTYDRLQSVITYYMKSINASMELLKLRSNELDGVKQKTLDTKIAEMEKSKNKVVDKLDKIFSAEAENLNKIEEDLEKIYEEVKDYTRNILQT